jgi:hypothetical protein
VTFNFNPDEQVKSTKAGPNKVRFSEQCYPISKRKHFIAVENQSDQADESEEIQLSAFEQTPDVVPYVDCDYHLRVSQD